MSKLKRILSALQFWKKDKDLPKVEDRCMSCLQHEDSCDCDPFEEIVDVEEDYSLTEHVFEGTVFCGDCNLPETECSCDKDFTVILVKGGDKKVNVIKAIRQVTGEGLKEAKEMVDTAPSITKSLLTLSMAEEFANRIELSGGSAIIVPDEEAVSYLADLLARPKTLGDLIRKETGVTD